MGDEPERSAEPEAETPEKSSEAAERPKLPRSLSERIITAEKIADEYNKSHDGNNRNRDLAM